MLSIMKLVTFIVGILVANCTRIPMEIVQLTSTQIDSNNDTNGDPTTSAVTAADIHASVSPKLANGLELHAAFDQQQQQQRKGRQLVDAFTLHQPRILYQVGVSVDAIYRFSIFSVSIGIIFSSQMSTSASVLYRSIDAATKMYCIVYIMRLPTTVVQNYRPFLNNVEKKIREMIRISCRQHLWSVGCRSCALYMT